jgi:hypothetical protein
MIVQLFELGRRCTGAVLEDEYCQGIGSFAAGIKECLKSDNVIFLDGLGSASPGR